MERQVDDIEVLASLSGVRRDLFNAADARQERENDFLSDNDFIERNMDETSARWEFDFRKGIPFDNPTRYLWEKVEPVTINNNSIRIGIINIDPSSRTYLNNQNENRNINPQMLPSPPTSPPTSPSTTPHTLPTSLPNVQMMDEDEIQ